jgi:hypothetical protein
MTNGNGGNSILKVVELFIDNINESTKTLSQGLERLDGRVENIKVKINTPPRNEELEEDHVEISSKIDTLVTTMEGLKSSIKIMTNTVKVALAVLTIAALLTSAVVYFGNKSLVNQLNTSKTVEIHELLEDLKGVIDENDEGTDG